MKNSEIRGKITCFRDLLTRSGTKEKGVLKVFKKHKRPRESTDLDEYVVVVPKKFI